VGVIGVTFERTAPGDVYSSYATAQFAGVENLVDPCISVDGAAEIHASE
jgi:hypothetical protein